MKTKIVLMIICILTFTGVLIMFFGFRNDSKGGFDDILFGKNITINISAEQIVDASYLRQILNGEVKVDTPSFDLWNSNELNKMILFMEENHYQIIPGVYTFNQSWKFEDGLFVMNSGEKKEIFKFNQRKDRKTRGRFSCLE